MTFGGEAVNLITL